MILLRILETNVRGFRHRQSNVHVEEPTSSQQERRVEEAIQHRAFATHGRRAHRKKSKVDEDKKEEEENKKKEEEENSEKEEEEEDKDMKGDEAKKEEETITPSPRVETPALSTTPHNETNDSESKTTSTVEIDDAQEEALKPHKNTSELNHSNEVSTKTSNANPTGKENDTDVDFDETEEGNSKEENSKGQEKKDDEPARHGKFDRDEGEKEEGGDDDEGDDNENEFTA